MLAGTFTMSGGRIAENRASENGGGVYIGVSALRDNIFTMTDGEILRNAASDGGGVYIAGVREALVPEYKGGIFAQRGGRISSNSASLGGGVYVNSHAGRYDRTGGTVTNNTTTHTSSEAMPGSNSNVHRRQGALGSGW
jgi:hypothetical protein